MDTRNSPANAKHILVVDDDIELALTFQALLEVHDYQASTAANGLQALKLLRESDVDAVLCDLSMPELSGDLFYNEVGRLRPHLLKRFIFVTANADNPLYETFLRRIKAPVLAKPVSFDRLLEKLKAILGTAAEPSK
jgi:CheY-like chemotaxis protein